MTKQLERLWLMPLAVAFAVMGLTACSQTLVTPAPVEVVDTNRVTEVLSSYWHRDHHVVQPGDTLYAIAFAAGQDYRYLARLNQLDREYTIYPGQRLSLTGNAQQFATLSPSSSAYQANTSLPLSAPTSGVIQTTYSPTYDSNNSGLTSVLAPSSATLPEPHYVVTAPVLSTTATPLPLPLPVPIPTPSDGHDWANAETVVVTTPVSPLPTTTGGAPAIAGSGMAEAVTNTVVYNTGTVTTGTTSGLVGPTNTIPALVGPTLAESTAPTLTDNVVVLAPSPLPPTTVSPSHLQPSGSESGADVITVTQVVPAPTLAPNTSVVTPALTQTAVVTPAVTPSNVAVTVVDTPPLVAHEGSSITVVDATSASQVVNVAAPTPPAPPATTVATPAIPVADVNEAALSEQLPDRVASWQWPLEGQLLRGFSTTEHGSKGLDIAAPAGTPVRSTAVGRVVYAGNALRGLGQLVIIKHSEDYLSAYAHNRRILVKEKDFISAGQIIAEVGDTDASRNMLHFEIRYKGKPVDPLKHLPKK
ncbi:MAG: peptidoglycan DD-metalloendopeptidase family protein [Ferrimonas sp.]